MTDRYAGKPLLRLLELYVLRAIGQTSQDEEQRLSAMAPKFAEIYDHAGEWHEIIAAAVRLPQDAPDQIRGLWEKNQAIARANGVELSAQQFAEMFVDQNFLA